MTRIKINSKKLIYKEINCFNMSNIHSTNFEHEPRHFKKLFNLKLLNAVANCLRKKSFKEENIIYQNKNMLTSLLKLCNKIDDDK